jgi:hypothetical protein
MAASHLLFKLQARSVLEFPAAQAASCECAECAIAMGDCAEKEDALKAAVLEEREACRNLLGTSTLLFLQHGERYALVPRVWLSHWRRWIASSPWKEQGGLKAARATGGAVAVIGGGVVGLTEALREHTMVVDGELRLLQHVPELKAHRDKWCQVLLLCMAGLCCVICVRFGRQWLRWHLS